MNEGLAKKVGRSETKKGAKIIAEMVAELFAIRTYSHRAHLKTPSYAKHKALNKFYDEIVDLTDSLAEGAQGVFGKLDIPVLEFDGDVLDPIGELSGHIEMLSEMAMGCDKAFLQNIFQEIEALYYSTLYKLRELD